MILPDGEMVNNPTESTPLPDHLSGYEPSKLKLLLRFLNVKGLS